MLKEAEVREGGERLGEVGSRIVAETFIGVLLTDPESYLSQRPGLGSVQAGRARAVRSSCRTGGRSRRSVTSSSSPA